ncbi:MAG: LysR family transcriptional regulator [Rhodobacteraceae bacterium]|nr:LysR family transcriptional regulator [Paracoccaceae bacterium]
MAATSGRISLWAVEVFLATAREGSVSAAARQLGASPSAISQQLSTLEAALGAVLLERGARPVTLTSAGEMFRPRAEAILSEALAARAELALADPAAMTRFRLGMIEDFEAEVTPRLLTGMADDLRACRFVLETGPSHRLLDQLDNRALDVVVAADTGAAADWMEVHPLLTEPFVAAVPRGAIESGAGAVDTDVLGQLQALPLILYSPRHHMGRLISNHLAHQNLRLAYRFELDSYHAIMAMVAAGAGWTILTPLALDHANRFRNRVEVLPLPVAPLSRTISLSARRGVLQAMPTEVAGRLRALLRDLVVSRWITTLPWIGDSLRVL